MPLNENENNIYSKYQLQAATSVDSMGLGAGVMRGAVAAVTDFGATLWNSVAAPLGADETDTASILSRIDKDALQVYNEHPDAVRTASFIGGVFVPAGLALKGMTALRAGTKGVSWFSTAGETSNLTAAANAFKNSKGSSEILTQTKKTLYGAMAANAVVDNVAMEAAIVTTMNAHPFMEDYMDDLPSNFLLGAAIGSTIGLGVGAIQTGYKLKNVLQPIEVGAYKVVGEGMEAVSEAMNKGDQLFVRQQNIANWEATLKNKPDLDTFTVNVLDHVITANKAKLVTDFETMAKGELATTSLETRNYITDLIKSDIQFAHVDEVSYLKVVDVMIPEKKTGLLQQIPELLKKVTGKTGQVTTKKNSTVFLPEFRAFVSEAEAGNYSSLADFTQKIETLKTVSYKEFSTPRVEAALNLQTLSTAEIEADYAKALLFIGDKSMEELNKMKFSPDDLSVLKAIKIRYSELPIEELAIVRLDFGTELISSMYELVEKISKVEAKFDLQLKVLEFSPESIAKRLGISDEFYKQHGAGLGATKFTSEQDIIAALDPTKRALVLNTNLQKTPFAELRSSLNNNTNDMMNSNIVEAVIHGSQDEIVRGVGALVGSPDMRIQIKAMMDGISEVSVTGLGSTLFRSANTAVERFGVAGTIATKIGSDVTHYINKTTEKLVKPISDAMGSIVKKESLVYEANMAMNVNASIAGPRVYKDGQFWTNVFDEELQQTVLTPVKYQGKEFRITSPEVLRLFETFQTAGRSMYHLANSSNKILGKTPVTDLGFWIPAFNPRNKEVAYVLSNDPAYGTRILWAKTSGELNDKINAFEKAAKAEGRNVTIASKDSNFESFNKLQGREELMSMQVADISMQHTGSSANAIVSTGTELLTEVINSYDHLVAKGVTDLVDIQLAPVMDRLQMVSELSQRLHNPKGMGEIQKALSSKKDPGMVMRNILLGKGLLSEHQSWAGFQQKTQVFTDLALEKISSMTTPILQKLGEKGARTEESFIQFNKEIEAAGFTPFKAVDDFVRYQQEGRGVASSMTPRAIALFNATAATTLLRFMELAQPFVNMISMPILMSGAMRKELSPVFMGKELVGDPQFKLAATIHDAIRLMNHPTEGARIAKLGEERELFKSIVSEANAAMAHAKSLDPGLMAKGESLLETSFIKVMSKPADWSETMTRKMAFFTGYSMAKKAYPGMDEIGNITFARSFMDEAIGNYTASQRPAMFQGTFGVAMGIFQTYMFTLGQQLYRGIERSDWIGLSKQMLTQSTVFGASSLPGFHVISEQIGSQYSDNHVDLTTGLIRAVDDDVAKTLLYGLPASIGMGITTRGDIQPRLPNPIQGLDSLAAYNMTKQAWTAGKNITMAALSADENAGQAFVEALSTQSISRPIARLSELVSGRSVTGAGNTIASNTTGNPFSEEFILHGAIARVMATRPIEEVMARQAIQLDSVYKGVDGDNRRALIKRLRSHIKSGRLDPSTIQEMQFEYLKTGSPQGWRASVNDALRENVEGGNAGVKSRLAPDAPYQRMVDDLG